MIKDLEQRRACARRAAQRYRVKNRDEINRKLREYARKRRLESPDDPYSFWVRQLWHRYKITPEQYRAKLSSQNNLCALCGMPFDFSRKGTRPSLDHNHITQKLRDFIHSNCNVAIGLLQDDPALCRKAAEYLERHGRSDER